MLVNLNNNNCYHKCVHIYWRIFLTNKLKSQFNAKIVNNGIVDIGQYKFAKQIGFCFDQCKMTKIENHKLFKDEPYYSKSYILTYNQLSSFKKQNPNLFKEGRWVQKISNSYGGKGVFAFNSWDGFLARNRSGKLPFILQKEIKPALYNGYKFDMRSHILIIKEHGKYEGYIMDLTWVRVKDIKFSMNNANGFVTNYSKVEDFKELLKKKYGKDSTSIYNKYINVLQRMVRKNVERLKYHNEIYFNNKKAPPYQLIIMGYDIILNENNEPYLLEANNYPGFLMNTKTYTKYRTAMETNMCNKVWEKAIVPWIHNQPHKIGTDNYFLKC